MKQSIQTISVSRSRLFLSGALLGLLASPVATAQTQYDPVYGGVVSTETRAGAPLAITRDAFGAQALTFNTNQISLQYDPGGRRALKQTDTDNDTAYLYAQSGLSPRVAVDKTNDKLTYYIPGLQNIDSDAATRQTLINSYNGSTLALVDPLVDPQDIILGRYAYDTIGRVDRIVDCAPSQAGCDTVSSFPFLYQGHEYDTETGLHNFVARMYSADNGRFLHLDSAGQAIAYEAMLNTWPNAVDPDGNLSWLILDRNHFRTDSLVQAQRKIQSELDKYAARHNGRYPDFEIYMEATFHAFAGPHSEFRIEDKRFQHYVKMDRYLKMMGTRTMMDENGRPRQVTTSMNDLASLLWDEHKESITDFKTLVAHIMRKPESKINLASLTLNDLVPRLRKQRRSNIRSTVENAAYDGNMMLDYVHRFRARHSLRPESIIKADRPISDYIANDKRQIMNINFARKYAKNITMFKSHDRSKGIPLMVNDLNRHEDSPDIYRFGIIGSSHFWDFDTRRLPVNVVGNWYYQSDMNLGDRLDYGNVKIYSGKSAAFFPGVRNYTRSSVLPWTTSRCKSALILLAWLGRLAF